MSNNRVTSHESQSIEVPVAPQGFVVVPAACGMPIGPSIYQWAYEQARAAAAAQQPTRRQDLFAVFN